MEWVFYELIRHAIVIKKAQEEVRRVIGNKEKVEENGLTEMVCLKCIIKETLRSHPPVALLICRESSAHVKLGGFDIPPNTRLFMIAWAIQRGPQGIGETRRFIPERFNDNLIDFKGQPYVYLTFGSGRKGCPGMSFGLAMVEYVLANLS